ncbi:hypothetical protein BRD00_15030 [Halobacteriales archaeon QS_8_69_26]|nr:MAG: hypothetical protein BRD00_15030 [Halobacteriales archaeon QS_8_69_26]
MFPTGLFESRTQRRILRVLAEGNRQYTIRELAEACHRSPSTVSRALSDADRYPFLDRSTVPGSKQYVYSLDPASEYTSAIREFFAVERRRERHDGTVPVGVWNLLEDVTERLEGTVDGFVEAYLFGPYATGDYYVGGEVDLLVVVDGSVDGAATAAESVLTDLDTDPSVRGHVTGADPSAVGEGPLSPEVTADTPVDPTDRVIPLSGGASS